MARWWLAILVPFLIAAKPAAGSDRDRGVEPFVLAGYGGAFGQTARSGGEGWFVFQAGLGFALSRNLSLDVSAGNHLISTQPLYSTGEGPHPDWWIVRLWSITGGVTIASSIEGPVRPCLSIGAGVYSYRSRFSPAHWSGSSRTQPGLTAAAGLKGREGRWSPRMELRLHSVPMTGKTDFYWLGHDWAHIVEASFGVQLP